MFSDLRFAIRMLLKTPGFTAIAILALGLGIGANTALFSVVSKVLYSPLPFHDADRMVTIRSTCVQNGIDGSNVSGPDYLDWRQRNHSFEELSSLKGGAKMNLTGRGEPVALLGVRATPNLFQQYGIQPLLGRTLLPEEEQAGKERVVVLSHRLWKRLFGSDPTIVGQTLTLSGIPYTVVGVLGPSLGFIEDLAEVFVPATRQELSDGRGNRHLMIMGRLKPNVTLAQAQADLAGVCQALEQENPNSNRGWSVRLVPMVEDLLQSIRPAFLILHGAVAFVLLIACANVANLLLARSEIRTREMAIRAVLGAGRFRIMRQLLTESLLLALCGGVLGVLLAYWGIEVLVRISPRLGNMSIPFLDQVGIDGRVLGFTMLVSLVTGLIFGLAPAWHAASPNLNEALKDGGKGLTSGGRRHRLLKGFVVAEVALALVLLVGAGLMIRSYQHLQQVNPGFNPHNVLALELELPWEKYQAPQKRILFYQTVLERLRTLKGVAGAGMVNILPMIGNNCNNSFEIIGGPALPPGMWLSAEYRVVDHAYFQTLQIPLRQGRFFTEQDNGKGAPVIIVNETFARKHFPEGPAVGRRLTYDQGKTVLEIVGVVGDEKCFGLRANRASITYQPYFQNCWELGSFVVRTDQNPRALVSAMRQQIWAVDPEQPISKINPMERLVQDSVAIPRFTMLMLTVFSGVALILASIGVYGVMAYSVSQRTHEIGVRMALGAGLDNILRLVMRQGVNLVVIGLVCGLPVAFALSRVMRSLLFDISVADPVTFLLVPLLLAGVALVACFLPARKAARTDPMVALRIE